MEQERTLSRCAPAAARRNGALGLIVNAIVLYNTIYTQRALDHLAATGLQVNYVDVERLSPLGSDHLTLTGRYRIALSEALRDRSAYRELNAMPAVAA
jgi:endonuclease/exonuclease/phosphatase (EEP) superfamily protein YafD